MSNFIEQYKSARRVGTPLMAIKTADPAAAIQTIKTISPDTTPLIQWDIVRGWRPINDAGNKAIKNTCELVGGEPQAVTLNPVEQFIAAVQLPPRSVLVIHNAHRYMHPDDTSQAATGFAQALWNLRDDYKSNLRTCILLAPDITLPAELAQDVFVIDEPLPDDDQLRSIIETTLEAANLTSTANDEMLTRATDAIRGLAAFPAEQVVAMSISKDDGLNLEALWERKRSLIEATPGLSVWRGGETFKDVGGVAQVKTYMTRLLRGREAPRVIVFIDEIEKGFAGATAGTSDSSGVSQGFHGAFLQYMENTRTTGVLELGPPGAAKSAIAKAAGAEVGIPTIALDLGGMKASLVGESESRLRNAFKIITAVGGGRALFLGTCNSITSLSPELRRRFPLTFFFDLPDKEERAAIWKIYLKRYELKDKASTVNDDGWTGAEIRNCCELAYKLDLTLKDAAQFIVPVSRSAADVIQTLRTQASGKFLSASYPGVYEYKKSPIAEVPQRRRFATADE